MLKDQVAVVTGGSRGIGKAIALMLAKEGAHVVINYTSSDEKAKEVKSEIEIMGGKAMIYKADVSNEKSVEEFAKAVYKEFGRIDILVNNAGITKDGLVMRMKEDDFMKVIEINLKGTFLCSKHFGKLMMKARYGKIINISSVVGVMGNAGQANYAASKAGVIGLTKSLAKEFASRNINVNAVAPGFIETEMTKELTEEVKESYAKAIPLGVYGQPEDVANLVVFLSSSVSNYITGQVINLDGGMVM
ncbi:MAG: 3-oxoacyl-[acyl-carrier-protein] reductase [Clostridiales bacterium]|nr:3-oxoacyl-[acyl-carrier-protein] reductase [Clostridiales bacterium]